MCSVMELDGGLISSMYYSVSICAKKHTFVFYYPLLSFTIEHRHRTSIVKLASFECYFVCFCS